MSYGVQKDCSDSAASPLSPQFPLQRALKLAWVITASRDKVQPAPTSVNGRCLPDRGWSEVYIIRVIVKVEVS
jgi:hypothetical protein